MKGIRRIAVVLLMAAALSSCGAFQYIQAGTAPIPPRTSYAVVYLKEQQYDLAFDLLRTRASEGDLWGNAYLFGVLGEPGQPPAEIRQLVGDRLDLVFYSMDRDTWFYPPNVPLDARHAMQMRVEEAIRKRDPDREYLLGMKLLTGGDSVERLPQAIGHLNRAADQGNKGALALLGHMDRRVLEARGLASRHVP